MIRISAEDIAKLNIAPAQCVNWVREALLMKYDCQLPPKMSVHPRGNDFFTTMPCLLPEQYHTFGCKIVDRIRGAHPALKSELMVFDTLTGEMTAIINSDWITNMRTGAVATLAIQTLRNTKAKIYGFVGLGAVCRATLDCLLPGIAGATVRLKRYKDHAEQVMNEYGPKFPEVKFEICDTMEELVTDADVVVSGITDADGLLVNDASLFKPGVLVVPIHTRGFQNCDTVFDRIVADDEGHVRGFKYFSQFRSFTELSQVLNGSAPGRTSDLQRILAYNIGLGLHDIWYGYKILQMIND